MTSEWKQPRGPSPEQLAAYADGELHGSDCAEMEAWLVEHPDVAAEVDGSRRLMRLWETTIPRPPSPSAWAGTLAGIEARLSAARPHPTVPGPWRGRLGVAVVAVAVLLALLARSLWDVSPDATGPAGEATPFPVASAQDVTILSMDPGDTANLVVGHPPILGNLDLADHGDVTLLSRLDPEIRLEDWAAPMIVDPLALTSERDR